MPKVTETFSEAGVPADKEAIDKRAKGFIGELLWCVEAKGEMA